MYMVAKIEGYALHTISMHRFWRKVKAVLSPVLYMTLSYCSHSKQLVQRSEIYTPVLRSSLHGEGFSCPCLPVGKDTDIVAIQHRGDNWRCVGKHLSCICRYCVVSSHSANMLRKSSD